MRLSIIASTGAVEYGPTVLYASLPIAAFTALREPSGVKNVLEPTDTLRNIK